RSGKEPGREWATDGGLGGRYRAPGKDGPSRHVECRAVANVIPGLHLIVMRDVTDRIEATERLCHLARVLDQTQESIVSTDLEGTITSWNAGAERFFGSSGGAARGRHLGFVLPD